MIPYSPKHMYQGIFFIMNKLQKILWSIFSGMICIVYRSDALTVSKTCPWTLKDSIELTKDGCNGIQVKDSPCKRIFRLRLLFL